MNIAAKVASALSFAHLAGIGRNASSKATAEDDENKDKPERDHEDGDSKKSKKAEDSKPEDDEKKDNKYASAEDDDDDDDDSEKKTKAKGSASDDKKKDGDDDRDEEMRGNSVAAQARVREQMRCAAIFGSPAAARNPVLAANLAFKTRLSRSEALAVLEATPAAASPSNAGRAARNPNVGAGGSMQPTSKQAVSNSWDRAFASASPKRRSANQ